MTLRFSIRIASYSREMRMPLAPALKACSTATRRGGLSEKGLFFEAARPAAVDIARHIDAEAWKHSALALHDDNDSLRLDASAFGVHATLREFVELGLVGDVKGRRWSMFDGTTCGRVS